MKRFSARAPVPAIAFFAALLAGSWIFAQRAFNRPMGLMRPNAVVGGVVNLPYMVNDNSGNQWRIFQNGWLQQIGNMPIYSQGASILINGNQVGQTNNQGRMDEKTGELILENL